MNNYISYNHSSPLINILLTILSYCSRIAFISSIVTATLTSDNKSLSFLSKEYILLTLSYAIRYYSNDSSLLYAKAYALFFSRYSYSSEYVAFSLNSVGISIC
jgi:hypothetical protein